jgi:hypothetical protein
LNGKLRGSASRGDQARPEREKEARTLRRDRPIKQTEEEKMSNEYSCICDDCAVNIIDAGEYVMLSPQLWDHELGLGWNDNLCISCVEKRLGRRIKFWGDVINMQNNRTTSMRLLVRMLGKAITKRKPYRLKACANVGGLSAKEIAKIGGARDAGL